MKIVILDAYVENPGDLSWDALGALGELTVYDRVPEHDPAEIARYIGDAEIVVTNKTPIGREVLDACPGVRYIAILATGYNLVDVDYAREKGVAVSNVPARTQWRSSPLRCCWRSAAMWRSTTAPSTRASGRTARSGATGSAP